MLRRDFIKDSLLTAAGVFLPSGLPATTIVDQETSPQRPHGPLHVDYIRTEVPSFEIPPYRGQTYTDTVPDTLDVGERARLCINALTAIADPQADYEIYGAADFFRNPPAMMHDFNDWVQNQEGFMEALPLLRLATGDRRNHEVDPAWMSTTLKSVGPDGLIYLPLNGRPWSRLNFDGVSPVWTPQGTTLSFKDPQVSFVANASTCQRMIGTMALYYLRDNNPMWKATVEKMIGRLADIAINRGDYCYFAPGSFEPHAQVDPNAQMPVGSLWGVSWNARLIQGLSQYFRVTGYEPARELAEKVTRYTRVHGEVFDSDGRWLLDPEFKAKLPYPSNAVPAYVQKDFYKQGLKWGGHSHGHLIALLSLLELATATGDHELLHFAKASFEWSKNPGADYGVSTLVGWFPEFYIPFYPSADADPQADMLALALKLSEAGVGDYWDDIDRWVRNQFFEQQLTNVDWVYKLASRSPRKPVAWNESADHVPEKSLGGFGSSVSGNDWALGLASTGIAQCCTGSCSRTIYYVWEHILDFKDGQLSVNLLLNRASRWADVHSHIPYQGRVEVKIKESLRSVRLRAPEWITTGDAQLVCKVNGTSRSTNWQGRYIQIGGTKPGDVVSITFPISERTVREKIGPVTYTLVIKGNTVVSIDPLGKNGPLYQDRAKYRKNETQWGKVTQFAPETEIPW
jgi:hypothetical protein